MSDETTTTAEPVDATAASLIAQVWGDESGPSTGASDEPAKPADDDLASKEPAKVEEPVKDERAEKVATRIALAKRAELRAAKERHELNTARAEHQKREADMSERAKQLDALDAAKLSPSKLLELYGKSPKEFLESLANEHEPEAVAKRAAAGTITEVQKLQARIDAMEAADRQRVAQQEHAEVQRATQESGDEFTEHVAANAEKYPALVETMTPAEFVHAAFAALDAVVGKDASGRPVTRLQAYRTEHDGQVPTHDEIAEFLEYEAQPRLKARGEWRARYGQKAQPPSEGTHGQAVATPTDPGPGPRTLTSRDASIKASAPKPWSQDAADEESLKILRAAMRG